MTMHARCMPTLVVYEMASVVMISAIERLIRMIVMVCLSFEKLR